MTKTIDPRDVRRAFFKGSGPGGQHKNKTETCVRLYHEPTGLVAEGKSERSRHQNEQVAYSILQAKVERLLNDLVESGRRSTWASKPDASYGHAIRTYRLCGNSQNVTDHRTGTTAPDSRAVLRGGLDRFLLAEARARKEK